MKLVSFNCTIELSKDENGYSNNYYVDVTDKGVYVSHPYITQTPEQVIFVTNLVHDFIAQAIAFNIRVDGFNRDNHLEQYAPKVSTDYIAPEIKPDIALETSPESAAPQSCALGDEEVSTGADGDIDKLSSEELEKSSSQICITKITEEDDW